MIYVMHSPAHGLCKIGISDDPRRRLREVKKHRRLPDLLLHREIPRPGPMLPSEVEALAHLVLARRHVFGEWFACAPVTAERAIALAVRIGESDDVELARRVIDKARRRSREPALPDVPAPRRYRRVYRGKERVQPLLRYLAWTAVEMEERSL